MTITALLLLSAYLGAAPGGPAASRQSDLPLTMDPGDNIEAAFTPQYVTCMNTGGAREQATDALLNCKQDELSRQDDKLNRIYKSMQASARDKAERSALTTMENKWIKARDAMCDSESEDAGQGTLSAVVLVDCRLRYTTKRTIDLQRMKDAGD